MSYANFGRGPVAAVNAAADERAEFIRKTYLHLGAAVVAFTALTGLFIRMGLAEGMIGWLGTSRFAWLIIMGAFMLVGHVAQRWAATPQSTAMQYAGLGLYVVAEALIFTPIMYIASRFYGDVLGTAGILTLCTFGGLTATVFISKKDFGFMGRALTLAGFAALGMIVVSIIFGFTLGALFSAAMVVLAAGYVLYYTSNVLYRYPVGAHVAASLALFSAIALLFWYILRLLMSLNRR
jgi:FtsH-binding integral membrane protein